MNVLAELGAFLAAAPQSLGVLDESIFLGTLPASPDECIALLEYGGLAPEEGFGVAGVKYETPAVQVLVRGEAEDYEGPMAVARLAWRALMAVQPGALVGVVGSDPYLKITPQQSPFLLRRDENERVLIACNFLCEKEPSA